MKTINFSAALVRLIERFQAWDQSLTSGHAGDPTGLSSHERGALLDELLLLLGEQPRAPHPGDPWRIFTGLFAPRATTLSEERIRRELLVLRAYEQLCECDLPFHVSSVLLRHYSVIKRASHVAGDERPTPPTPARGIAIPSISRAAVPARVTAR